jgi:guanylate kinase
MINRNEFLEYAHVFGHAYYGTPIQYVKSKLDEGFNVLFDIDVQGAKQIKQKYQSQCVTIFINAPSFDELEKRLTNRKTDSVESIQKRLMTAKKEIAEAATFDYTIINKDIEDSYQQLISIFEKESCL